MSAISVSQFCHSLSTYLPIYTHPHICVCLNLSKSLAVHVFASLDLIKITTSSPSLSYFLSIFVSLSVNIYQPIPMKISMPLYILLIQSNPQCMCLSGINFYIFLNNMFLYSHATIFQRQKVF